MNDVHRGPELRQRGLRRLATRERLYGARQQDQTHHAARNETGSQAEFRMIAHDVIRQVPSIAANAQMLRVRLTSH